MSARLDSISKLISVHFKLGLNDKEFQEIFKATMLHFSGVVKAFEFQKWLKPYCEKHSRRANSSGKPLSGKDFRLILDESGYCLLNVNMFAKHYANTRAMTDDKRYTLAKTFKISKCDYANFCAALTDKSFKQKLMAHCKTEGGVSKLLSLENVDIIWSHIHTPVLKYIHFMIRTKLHFICKSQNIERADFVNDLHIASIKAFYKKVNAGYSLAHLQNSVKLSVHNRAINIIEENTTQKRGRLINVGVDGRGIRQFSLLAMSANQIGVEDTDAFLEQASNDFGQQQEHQELRLSVEQLINTVNSTGTQFITLLMGVFDPAFTAWLRLNKKCGKLQDNTDVQLSTSPEAFTQLVSSYLQVKSTKADLFINSLRTKLGDYNLSAAKQRNLALATAH